MGLMIPAVLTTVIKNIKNDKQGIWTILESLCYKVVPNTVSYVIVCDNSGVDTCINLNTTFTY